MQRALAKTFLSQCREGGFDVDEVLEEVLNVLDDEEATTEEYDDDEYKPPLRRQNATSNLNTLRQQPMKQQQETSTQSHVSGE